MTKNITLHKLKKNSKKTYTVYVNKSDDRRKVVIV